jgi:hypothetical protein
MVGIELDFIKTEDVMENRNESTWEFAWKEVGPRVRNRHIAPRIATLGFTVGDPPQPMGGDALELIAPSRRRSDPDRISRRTIAVFLPWSANHPPA